MKDRASDRPERERRRQAGRRLTDRQALILELIAEGLENKQIAHRLGLSEQAIKEQVSTLLDRLAVGNRAALAEAATRLRIVGTMELDPEWLSYVYQQSPVMSAIVRGPDHVFVAANVAYRAAAGDRDILGLPYRDVFPAHVKLLDDVRASGRALLLHEFRGRWSRGGADEDDASCDVSLQPLPDVGGVAGISIALIDVTDVVRARQTLAELSAEQLATFDLVPSGIVVLDRRGQVVKVNRAAQSLLGPGPFARVSSETAKPYRLRDAATGRELAGVEEALTRVFAGEPLRDLRLRMYLPAGGRDADVRIDAEPLRAADGSVRGVVATVTEVAEALRPAG
ncbi:MAG TPA: PAS domain-containing protein [Candidatus Limnocylindria bacterium]|nr:PAS domain-containing protein [Candidatus Limnocylindria bacterium]